jgi:hypothetical protein
LEPHAEQIVAPKIAGRIEQIEPDPEQGVRFIAAEAIDADAVRLRDIVIKCQNLNNKCKNL